MRADRLLSLLLLLQARGRMTARELAERLEVSERTIYRDLDALSAAGVPIYTERGPGGGCELLDGYQTKLTGLTETEVRALFLLNVSHHLADLGLDQALEDALLKLSAALPPTSRVDATQVRQRIHLDGSLPGHNGHTLSHLQTIQQAIWKDYTLHLTYAHQCERVDPYGLVSKAGAWYLVGAISNQVQVFHISRIQAIELTEEHFCRPTGFDLAAYWQVYSARFQMSPPRSNVRKKSQFPAHSASTVHMHGGARSQRKKSVSRHNRHQKKPIILLTNRSSQGVISSQALKKAKMRDQLHSQSKKAPGLLTSLPKTKKRKYVYIALPQNKKKHINFPCIPWQALREGDPALVRCS